MLDMSCGLVEENRAQRAELAALRQEVELVRGQLEPALRQIVELEQRQSRKPPNIKPNRGESGGTAGAAQETGAGAQHLAEAQRTHPL